MPKAIDLTGKTINGFYIIGIGERTKGGHKRWLCKCKCGAITSIASGEIKINKYCSVCVPKGRPSHGLSHLPEFGVWSAMKQRCDNPNCDAYENYGARGISYCKEWNRFEIFLKDMGLRPSDQHTLERNDNDGNYQKSNCRWATRKEQARNFRHNVLLEFNGQKKCISEWGEIYGLKHDTIASRLERGLSIEQALTTPLKTNRKFISVNGELMSFSQAEKKLGFGEGVISYRLRHGYSEQEAVSLPNQNKLNKC